MLVFFPSSLGLLWSGLFLFWFRRFRCVCVSCCCFSFVYFFCFVLFCCWIVFGVVLVFLFFYFLLFIFCFFVVFLFGGFQGQVRWPKGPAHLALNPPFFVCFVECVFPCFPFFASTRKTCSPPPLKKAFLFIFLCLPLFLFSPFWPPPC